MFMTLKKIRCTHACAGPRMHLSSNIVTLPAKVGAYRDIWYLQYPLDDLQSANLEGANLKSANLQSAKLEGPNF